MISHLDNLLRHLFLSRVELLRPIPNLDVVDDQVRFQPPNEDWRQYVAALTVSGHPAMALNIYMVDLRENRKLRSNERGREISNGMVVETPAPQRVDCHYLITAWSPADFTPQVEPTLDEHALLYETTTVLMHNETLVPRLVYDPDPLPSGFPELLADEELPTEVLPVEGFHKLAEFWNTMGTGQPWKPAIYLIVTLPVALPKEISGPMVTTRITEYRQSGKPETAEAWIQIGGHVLDATGPQSVPLASAWVQLETPTGEPLQTTQTNELGRFTFNKLRPGQYQLRWRAGAFPEPPPRLIEVPSPSGEYDLKFV
jgi:hypothetical protein